jgi:hypothetical protein
MLGIEEHGMIAGTVNARYELLMRLPVRNAAGHEQEVEAVDAAPLLGMTLLIGYNLRVRVAIGGLVQIESIS